MIIFVCLLNFFCHCTTLSVATEPPHSLIFLNEKFIGFSPLSIKIKPQRYEILIKKEGFEPYQQEIKFWETEYRLYISLLPEGYRVPKAVSWILNMPVKKLKKDKICLFLTKDQIGCRLGILAGELFFSNKKISLDTQIHKDLIISVGYDFEKRVYFSLRKLIDFYFIKLRTIPVLTLYYPQRFNFYLILQKYLTKELDIFAIFSLKKLENIGILVQIQRFFFSLAFPFNFSVAFEFK